MHPYALCDPRRNPSPRPEPEPGWQKAHQIFGPFGFVKLRTGMTAPCHASPREWCGRVLVPAIMAQQKV